MLGAPLVEHARQTVPECCDRWVLVAGDWSHLHYNGHESKTDRIELSRKRDLGYELFTALAVSDQDGSPLAPLCLELRAQAGVYTTRSPTVLKPLSRLDGLEPAMDYVQGQRLGKPVVFIMDREADSVMHLRRWDATGKQFLVRANDNPQVVHEGENKPLAQVARDIRSRLKRTRPVLYQGKPAQQFVAETIVVLTRPACLHRVDQKTRRKKHKRIHGAALALRLVVVEVRDAHGKRRACWLLLSNLPASVRASQIALWYYWRWRIESYHKLLKSAGQQVEQWLQGSAEALVRRLIVTAMTAVLVWQIARDPSPQAAQLRQTLVKLSGRQMKRTKNSRGFTEPALLAGLTILVPMMIALEVMSPEELKAAAHELMPLIRSMASPGPSGSG